jgi:hypothetical protein
VSYRHGHSFFVMGVVPLCSYRKKRLKPSSIPGHFNSRPKRVQNASMMRPMLQRHEFDNAPSIQFARSNARGQCLGLCRAEIGGTIETSHNSLTKFRHSPDRFPPLFATGACSPSDRSTKNLRLILTSKYARLTSGVLLGRMVAV